MKKYFVSLFLLLSLFTKAQTLTVVVSANPDTVCAGTTTQLETFVAGGTIPYTYSWSSNPPGFSSNSAIPTATPFVSTWYIVTVTDIASNVGKDSIYITVLNVPTPVGDISGPTEICADSGAVYSIVEVEGADSYQWTLPAGATIIEGLNTPVINVKWGDNSGTVSVYGINGCGNGTPGSVEVTTFFPPPVPGAITGPTEMCKYQTEDFIVANVFGASSYHWIVPPDADILLGQGFRAVKVHWGETPGTISVACINFCGEGGASSKTITLGTLPGEAGVITGKPDPCRGQNGYVYSVEEITNATSYNWTLPEGAIINGVADGREIVVDFSTEAVSGDIIVKGRSACGDGVGSTKTIILNDCNAIDDLNRTRPVSIYPNPASEFIHLSFSQAFPNLMVTIVNAYGSTVYSESLSGLAKGSIAKIDVSALPAGLYLVKVHSSGLDRQEKILVR